MWMTEQSKSGKTLREIWRELSEARTWYAQFSIEYVHLELLYEPGFKSFPTSKIKNSPVDRVLIKHCSKGGALISKYPN